jgi:uncharacterized SAM-binding protein YcdF (DUF218 family)
LFHVGHAVFDPLFDALVLLVLSLVLRKRAPKLSRGLPAAALGLLLVFACPAVANRLMFALEHPTITTIQPDVTYDAVIMLGGTMDGMATADTGAPAYDEAVERILTTFDLLRTNRARFAIISGTSWAAQTGEAEPESRLIVRQLVAWGIDPARLVADEVSRNTRENAIESVRIAREHGWTRDVLVTSAAHMKRARGCFAKEGLGADTLSVDFSAYDPARHWSHWSPNTPALSKSTAALREWVARLAYRVRGWSE